MPASNALAGFIEVKAPGKGCDPRRYHRTAFPQRCIWLPAEEAARQRIALAADLTRLEAD